MIRSEPGTSRAAHRRAGPRCVRSAVLSTAGGHPFRWANWRSSVVPPSKSCPRSGSLVTRSPSGPPPAAAACNGEDRSIARATAIESRCPLPRNQQRHRNPGAIERRVCQPGGVTIGPQRGEQGVVRLGASSRVPTTSSGTSTVPRSRSTQRPTRRAARRPPGGLAPGRVFRCEPAGRLVVQFAGGARFPLRGRTRSPGEGAAVTPGPLDAARASPGRLPRVLRDRVSGKTPVEWSAVPLLEISLMSPRGDSCGALPAPLRTPLPRGRPWGG